MEPEKSHDRPSLSGTPKKAGGVTQTESQDLRAASILRRRLMSQLKQSGQEGWIFFALLFHSIPQRVGCCPPTLGRENCVTAATDSYAHFIQKHPRRYHQEIMFSQMSEHPIIQSRWHVKLTITPTLGELKKESTHFVCGFCDSYKKP